jgi:hypothetical protein
VHCLGRTLIETDERAGVFEIYPRAVHQHVNPPPQNHARVIEDAVSEVAVGGEAGVVLVVNVIAGDRVAAALRALALARHGIELVR